MRILRRTDYLGKALLLGCLPLKSQKEENQDAQD